MRDPREVYITTVSGTKFYFLDPANSEIRIEDIVHSLARICRYNGHLHTGEERIYSVAQHCVVLANLMKEYCTKNRIVGKERWILVTAALMHDSPEAYIGDITGPLKVLLRPLLHPIEDTIESVLEAFSGVPTGSFSHPLIRGMDLAVRVNEVGLMGTPDSLCAASQDGVFEGLSVVESDLRPWPIHRAQSEFMELWQNCGPQADPETTGKVIDLMAALKRSLEKNA